MTGRHEDTWKVGELAGSTGLTVRTLHHYDRIGLLSPSARTDAGHRRYDRDDVVRLYQIVALRGLGLSLTTIEEVLADGPPLGPVLRTHLNHVEQRLSATRALRDRLMSVVAASDAVPSVTAGDLLELIQEVNRMDEMMKTYFTGEQLETLARRNEESKGALAATREEWPALIAEVQGHIDAGTDPAAPPVQALARRWMQMLADFHGGDPALRDSLYRMYEENSDEISERGGPSPEMIDYVRRANAAAAEGTRP